MPSLLLLFLFLRFWTTSNSDESNWVSLDAVLNGNVDFIDGRGPHFPVVARIRHLVPLICSDDADKVLHRLVVLLNLRCLSHLLFFFIISNHKFIVHLRLALNLGFRCLSRIWLSLGLFHFWVFIETICFWTLSCDISHWRIHLLLLLPFFILSGSCSSLFFVFPLPLFNFWLLLLWTFCLSIITIVTMIYCMVSNWPCLAIRAEIGCLVGDQVHVCWLGLFL